MKVICVTLVSLTSLFFLFSPICDSGPSLASSLATHFLVLLMLMAMNTFYYRL